MKHVQMNDRCEMGLEKLLGLSACAGATAEYRPPVQYYYLICSAIAHRK